jgi:outer membrane protein OmpA-like peptidoglycan-associated protein
MKTIPLQLSLTLLAVALLSAACSSAPSTSQLDQARADYLAVQASPMAATYAPLQTKQAGDALALANTAADEHASQEKVDQLAYLAQQKIALTRETIKQKSAEAESAQAAKQRDQMLLDQRTAEADRAKLNTQIARNEASDAKRNTQVAQNEAANARQGAAVAQADAADAQRSAQEAQARSAQLEAQLSDLAAKKTARGDVITLGDVLFGTDLARLNTDGMRSAQKLVTLLQDNPQRSVLIEGFADSTGSTAHNQDLSERRANAVRSALVEMGVARERIAIRGYGEALPVAANDTAANRQLNRRVEIVLSDDKGSIAPR